MSKPLEGLRVLDVSEGIPYIGSMFADYGAEVLKVERPGTGDAVRGRGASQGVSYASYYLRGKKSLAVDYTVPAGAQVVARLAAGVDMVVFTTAEDALRPLGLDYASLKAANPKLVYGVLTPFGEAGPWKDLPDYDLLVMARSGLLEKTGFPEKPTKFGFPLGYVYASWHLTAGMMAAYLAAQSSGEGRKVSCSSWQTMMQLDDTFAECFQALNTLPKRLGNGFPTTNPTDTFRCKNGWFALSVGSDAQWLGFAHEAGMDAVWGEGTVYAHDPERSMDHYFGELDGQLRDYFATITIEEADQICRRAMVPGGPCNTVVELASDEQVAIRNMLIPVGGETQLGVPAKFVGQDGQDSGIAPGEALGASTRPVLAGAGIAPAQLDELQAQGVIACGE